MKSLLLAPLVLFFALTASAQTPAQGFAPLFNGRDFTGWDIAPDLGAWTVENGEIRCKGKPGTPYLIRTLREYENFEFTAEFNVSKGCNTGIFFHVMSAGRESRIGFEAQILDDSGTPVNRTSTGSIYDVLTPLENAMKPAGEWNRYRVLINWPSCKIWLNDRLVQDADFSKEPVLKYRLRRGIIGLSNHGFPVSYRDVTIRELPDTEKWDVLFNSRDLSGWKKSGKAKWKVVDGVLVASGGDGWLVSEREYGKFQFQAVVENDTLQARGGGFYYRWRSPEDPGYPADFYDYPAAVTLLRQYGKNVPETVIPAWKNPVLLYQIMSADRESEIRVGGYITAKNMLLGKVRPGRIAIHHAAEDGVLRIRMLRVKELDGKGI